jgi:hypothetical protein
MRERIETTSTGREALAGDPQAARRQRRRWLRRLAAGAVGLLVVTLALYGWAWSSVGRSTTARALVWSEADVGDQYRFPSRLIPAGAGARPLPSGGEIDPAAALSGAAGGGAAFDDVLRATDTLAFLVVHDDRLVYERYFDGADRRTRQTSYLATRLWQPLGAEGDATWNLDSERSGFEKLESGLNATPVDFARFGQLFLHHGESNGTRIVSKGWVRAATAADITTDPADLYQYFWWIDVERPGRFYALGNYGQYIYMAPDADAVVVRFGRDWGVDNRRWLATFRDIADQLAPRR